MDQTTLYSTQGKWRKQVTIKIYQCAWSAHTHSACMHITLQLEKYTLGIWLSQD